MSENGECVACFSYGGLRCRQLTSIQAPGSTRVVLRKPLASPGPAKSAIFGNGKPSGQISQAFRYYVMLSYNVDITLVRI